MDKLIVILGIPEIIVHRSDLFICFCKLIDDLALTINSFNKKPLPLNKLQRLKFIIFKGRITNSISFSMPNA